MLVFSCLWDMDETRVSLNINIVNINKLYIFIFMQQADTILQGNSHKKLYILLVCISPGNQTHEQFLIPSEPQELYQHVNEFMYFVNINLT